MFCDGEIPDFGKKPSTTIVSRYEQFLLDIVDTTELTPHNMAVGLRKADNRVTYIQTQMGKQKQSKYSDCVVIDDEIINLHDAINILNDCRIKVQAYTYLLTALILNDLDEKYKSRKSNQSTFRNVNA